jgi:type IV pilus assembly protein PilC
MISLFLGIGIPILVVMGLGAVIGLRASGGEPTFRCVAYENGTWAMAIRTVVAGGPEEAAAVLESQGYVVREVRRVWPVGRFLERGVRFSDFRRSIPQRQIAEMADSIATLLVNNITIQDAIPMYTEQKPDNKCREVLRRIHFDITSGAMSVEEAFAARSDQFGHEVATMVRVGATTEAGIEGTFRQIAEMADRRADLGSQMRRAFIEPAMIGLTVFALLIYMSVYVLPQFKSFYEGYGASLPWITTFTLAVTDWCIRYFWLLVLVAAGIGVFVWWLRHNRSTRLAWDRAVVHLPVYGRITRAAALGRVMGTISSMIPVGVPIQVALPESVGTAKNTYIEDVLTKVSEEIGPLSFQEAVKQHARDLPPNLVAFVHTGAAAGALEDVLDRYARITVRDVESATESLQSFLKTGLIVLIGIPTAWVMAAMWWPMIFYIRIIH